MTLLDGLRVVDFTSGIAGPYASKLLADAGADVVKVEAPSGDPLRRWTASSTPLDGCDSALFRFLNTSKRSVIGDIDTPSVKALVAGADLVLEDGALGDEHIADLVDGADHVVASITPFGRSGPRRDAPWTEFTLQAWCGSIAGRGTPDRPPLYAAGRFGEWISGTYAAVGALGALHGRRAEHVDVSMLECMTVTLGGFGGVYAAFAGALEMAKSYDGPVRSVEIPSIHPTADGLVGFCTVTGQQFQDFLILIERADLLGDERFSDATKRIQHQAEFEEMVVSWTSTRTTEEVVDLASAFRIPVTPIGTPEVITSFDHFEARGVFTRNPGGGFRQPRVPYLVSGVEPRPFTPAPSLGERENAASWPERPEPSSVVQPPAGRPLDGVRIVDLTAFWAGPSATQMLAALGADVVKVEGLARPDGMRFGSARRPGDEQWWEASAVFHSVNTNKRAVTLDLGTDEGRALVLDLIDGADGVIENFSPRVLDAFGLTWDEIHARSPRTIMVRMPSFGLDGPWRDRTGFAQTMEQVSGLAWLSGYPDGAPVIPRGACDPLAGMHATFAFLAALRERGTDGEGRFVEVSMVEAALNCAAEVVIEHEAYGQQLTRDGNRGPRAAPQGVYACEGTEQWLALAVTGRAQWDALVEVLDLDRTAVPPFDELRGRHDEVDRLLADALATRARDTVVAALLERGVPCAPVVTTARVFDDEQMRARGFFEAMSHPVMGEYDLLGVPFRYSSREGAWFERPAPTLGQHNHEVLGQRLGLDEAALAELETHGVIGTAVPQ